MVGYKYLKTYQLATVIYDLTVRFCHRYLGEERRMREQMIQAARSGKQNIAEGYLEKSLKMYIKLLGVSRGSLGELLEDFEDFARQRGIPVWPKERVIRAIWEIREIWGRLSPDNPYIPNLPENLEVAVNLLLTLTNQTNYLLDRQIASLEEKFIREGGWSENLFKRRLDRRNNAR